MKSVVISPSILSANFSCIADEIHALEKAGADAIHYDVMDNHFVPNLTFGFKFVEDAIRTSSIKSDVHLMIDNPENSIDTWIACMQKRPAMLTFHIEACRDANAVESTITRIRQAGIEAALSIKPNTPVSALTPYLTSLDAVLIMLVEPGFGGQGMIPETVAKIAELRTLCPNMHIQVDGGVKSDNYKELIALGADNLVIGSGIFALATPGATGNDYTEAIHRFRGA